jgi:hypothetical protein
MIAPVKNNTHLSIGAVFTPLDWAAFAAEQFGLLNRWLAGSTVFDPTMGEGNLLEALVHMGLKAGQKVEDLPIENLFGVELNAGHYERFFQNMKTRYGVEMPRENFVNGDILFQEQERQFDIVFGNPPWLNFTDLPDNYKQLVKPLFFQYDLVGNAQKLLLGGSRVDFSALIVQKTIEKNLRPGGQAVFFLPLSLFLNDGANQQFRTYRVNAVPYCVDKIFDFNDAAVFEDVATRYGLACFSRDKKQVFPVPFHRWEKGVWQVYSAQPALYPTDPLSLVEDGVAGLPEDFEPIALSKNSTPRQGVNSGGANNLFFFDEYQDIPDENLCRLSNKHHDAILPKQYVFPLLVGKNFRESAPKPSKWVFLPYHPNGKPLTSQQVGADAHLREYLLAHEAALIARKGSLLNALLQKHQFWAMLGVGDYNFYPWKIVWEAYGKTSFEPRIFEGHWQVNQSLQAYIPVQTHPEAEVILKKLQDKRIEIYLRSLKMEGTMNWAQPGKIKKLVRFQEEERLTLF